MTKEEYLALKEGDTFVFNEEAIPDDIHVWHFTKRLTGIKGTIVKPTEGTVITFIAPDIEPSNRHWRWHLWESIYILTRKPWEIIDFDKPKCSECNGTKRVLDFQFYNPCPICCPKD